PQQRANQVAHFLTQCLFCFFAEDVGLLPGRMFERLVNNRHITSDKLTQGLSDLFTAMQSGGMFGANDIPWFKGGLFKTIDVPRLQIVDVTELRNAAALNWSAIDVSIFGTLFERGLDPAKRSQLGAHYTDPATILRIVESVVQRPLLQIWKQTAQALQGILAKSTKKGDKNYRAAQARFIEWLDKLTNYRVLDPACGSGNFLFLGLKCLKDIEHRSHLDAAALGLDREADLVTGPHNVLGIELNEYAAELARVTVWIGELQWRMAHGYEFKTNPVLEPLDHIECRDALLTFLPLGEGRGEGSAALESDAGVDARDGGSEAQAGRTPGAHTLRFLKSPPTSAPPAPPSGGAAVKTGGGTTTEEETGSDRDFAQRNSGSDPASSGVSEANWPRADVVIGNPPFLGDKKMRGELGDAYTQTLRKTYEGRVPGGADLVCYWFEKARQAIESDGLTAAGLVATNSIRGGKNRTVLDTICKTTRIFEAWSDEGWVNEGAAVRVSLVAFGHAMQGAKLNGTTASLITADLTAASAGKESVDLATAKPINASGTSFIGTQKGGPFDIPVSLAREWLCQPNPNSRPNAEVLFPWINGLDITRRPQGLWIIDFNEMDAVAASLFEMPWRHCEVAVRPTREGNREGRTGQRWWLLQRTRPEMKAALLPISRYLATARVSKHRLFSWQPIQVLSDSQVVVIARADDTTFGILHSRFHELWSLRMGTSLEDRPRYTPTTCFETFPFPAGLTPLDTAHQRTEPVEGGALIPADLPPKHSEARMGRMSGAILKSEAYEPPASAPSSPDPRPQTAEHPSPRTAAIAIAQAAKRLSDLRENWLNPPEWAQQVPEVIPLGMSTSPYPDRIEPRPDLAEADLKALQKRTLTNLYNQRPAWLAMAHQQLDAAVATAYGWSDYTPAMPDDEILKRLLALNLERSGTRS
ncbi:DNA methyltransferase, partial [Polaromonas sp. C04]|uniref:class I SAM-dependent DNA methyltransferase n=1 Tax=Polaromonas sp. C04 TaxID=1945857 RepID=UPI0009841FEA